MTTQALCTNHSRTLSDTGRLFEHANTASVKAAVHDFQVQALAASLLQRSCRLGDNDSGEPPAAKGIPTLPQGADKRRPDPKTHFWYYLTLYIPKPSNSSGPPARDRAFVFPPTLFFRACCHLLLHYLFRRVPSLREVTGLRKLNSLTPLAQTQFSTSRYCDNFPGFGTRRGELDDIPSGGVPIGRRPSADRALRRLLESVQEIGEHHTPPLPSLHLGFVRLLAGLGGRLCRSRHLCNRAARRFRISVFATLPRSGCLSSDRGEAPTT